METIEPTKFTTLVRPEGKKRTASAFPGPCPNPNP